MTDGSRSPIHSAVMRSGQKVFAFDPVKGEMYEVIPQEAEAIDLGTGISIKRKSIDIQEGHLYVIALNKKNAYRKLLSRLKDV